MSDEKLAHITRQASLPVPRSRRPMEEQDGVSSDDASAATRRILGLLQGVCQPKDDPHTAKLTTLEYRGQWQPKPNGAETGHGEVPKDWALELASENDRALATFSWAGGAQLCLSNAFRQADQMETQARDLIDSGACTSEDAPVQCIRAIAKATEEREALMRRQWCDIEFQGGEDANKDVLQHLERDFAAQLSRVAARQLAEDDEEEAEEERAQQQHPAASSRVEDTEDSGFSRARGPWYNIKVAGGTRPGRTYLSAQVGGDGVDLSGYDDESGRQRWHIERVLAGNHNSVSAPSSGSPSGAQSVNQQKCFHIRLHGGTGRGRRFLSRGLPGQLQLCGHDDGSGRQRWHLVTGKTGCWVTIRPACDVGDPGLGAAAFIEAAARGQFLSAGSNGEDSSGAIGGATSSSLGPVRTCLCNTDDGSGRQRWVIAPHCLEVMEADSVSQGKEPSVGVASSSMSQASNSTHDDVVAIAVHSGGETAATTLTGLRPEQVTRVLSNNRSLGSAIDLVGAYLKNYEIDKADRVCQRIMPLCRERGGVWLFKCLNFYSTVRMKQSRHEEALEMYNEYETLIGFAPDDAWELFDTVYRNFGWIYTSLRRYEEALAYFEKAVGVKRRNGVQAHWFDQWDLGKTHARLSLQRGEPENLELAFKLIMQALDLHKTADPDDSIMRCKMLNSAGECASVIGDYCSSHEKALPWHDTAIALHRESYDRYMEVLGPSKPLTGWCMEDLAGALRRAGKHTEAKEHLHAALEVECSKDIIKLSSVARLLDSILDVHRVTSDATGLARCQSAVNIGLDNLQGRGIDRQESASYASLLQKIAALLLVHDPVTNREGAIQLLVEAVGYAEQALSSKSLGKVASVQRAGEASCQTSEQTVDMRPECLTIPKAGQQEMEEIDAATLFSELEKQLEKLRGAPQSVSCNLAQQVPCSDSRNGSHGGCIDRPSASPSPQLTFEAVGDDVRACGVASRCAASCGGREEFESVD